MELSSIGGAEAKWRQAVDTAVLVEELGYVDLGCTGFVPWCSDYPDTTSLRLFAERVMPSFR